jgi:hypothetical protein
VDRGGEGAKQNKLPRREGAIRKLGINPMHHNRTSRGAQLVGEVVQYKDAYRLCYIRGSEGLLIGLAQELS